MRQVILSDNKVVTTDEIKTDKVYTAQYEADTYVLVGSLGGYYFQSSDRLSNSHSGLHICHKNAIEVALSCAIGKDTTVFEHENWVEASKWILTKL